jgi:hypothetical protein
MSSPEFGAFFQCYKNPYATFICLNSFRTHYPNNTIVLLSDNGYDYSEMATCFNCIYIHENENARFVSSLTDVDLGLHFTNAHKLLERVRKCFSLCKEDYVIWLEDDVFIHDKINDNFYYDMNGYSPNTISKSHLYELSKTYKNIDINKEYRFTGHGGTIFHKNRFIEYSKNTEIINDLLINWKRYGYSELAQDFFFSLLVTLQNGTIGPYNGHGEFNSHTNITVRHQYKDFYGIQMPDNIKYLVKDTK